MVPVHFDEAQYSTWLANPDLSYQTKGPWVSATQSVTHAFEFLPQLVQSDFRPGSRGCRPECS